VNKSILILLFCFSNLYADVIYQKTGYKDPFGKTIVKLKIEGEIKEGDYERFKDAIIEINQNDYRVDEDSVLLDSQGGFMNDARKIGYLVRYNHLATKVNRNAQCSSACTYILVSGACRMALGEINVHNSWTDVPIESKDYVKNLTKWSAEIDNEFLKNMNATQEFIDLVNITPSWSYYKLSKKEKKRMGLFNSTEVESKYRLEIASRKLGKLKKDILEVAKDKSKKFGFIPKQLSCSEQFFIDQLENEDHLTDEFLEDNFEINEVQQFYVRSKNDSPEMINGEIKRYKNKNVPLENGNALIWEIQHFSKGKEVEYKEVTTLKYPGKWNFDTENIYGFDIDISISNDRKVATKIMKVENTGYITNGWGLDPEFDKPGPVEIKIYIDNKLKQIFNFNVVTK
jgi:ATP-dependent protease ClpP protease subunit